MSDVITCAQVTESLSRRLPIYHWRRPTYQTAMLRDLRRLWDPAHRVVLDVGGGTGVIAQAVKELFRIERIVSVDVEDRYLDSLTIETGAYDGLRLPYPDGTFDCVMFNNVLHHVPEHGRAPLLRECRRAAGGGPLYIKDHLARSRLDHLRLGLLDWIGNTPFNGMVEAHYLEEADWHGLAADAGFQIVETLVSDDYRSGVMGTLFPNRLEITMKWLPSAD